MIDKATEERIKSAVDIVDIIGEHVQLKKKGASYVGLCPFHDDHSPSFYVSPSRSTWHCFVCDEGGGAITFLMKKLTLTYPEALKHLAAKYSVPIPEQYLPKEEWIKQKETEAILSVNEASMLYYESCLASTDESAGLKYFHGRGFTEEAMKAYHVGYSPVKSDIIASIKEKNLEMKYLMPSDSDITFKSGKILHVENGVGTISQINGRFQDSFSGRVIFPWLNANGQVVAFGGRKLDEATKGVEMKYRNSPESLVYRKSHELWGLYQAKSAITRANEAYIVEGYTDVMMLHQTGIKNVVSCAGTALSPTQAHLLHRFCTNVTLMFDGDDAGLNAAIHNIDPLLQEGMNVKVIVLSDNEDPDNLAKRLATTEALKTYLQSNTIDFLDFYTFYNINKETDIPTKAAAITDLLNLIGNIPDKTTRSLYLAECHKRFNTTNEAVTQTSEYESLAAKVERLEKEVEELKKTCDLRSQLEEKLNDWIAKR